MMKTSRPPIPPPHFDAALDPAYVERLRKDTRECTVLRSFGLPIVGERRVFVYGDYRNYEDGTEGYPELSAHRGQVATIVRELDHLREYHSEPDENGEFERAYEARFPDGSVAGFVWETELYPLTLAAYETALATTTHPVSSDG